MNDHSPIIDVNPVASMSDAAHTAQPSGAGSFRAPSFGKNAEPAAAGARANTSTGTGTVANATIIGEGRSAEKKPSRLGGVVQTAVGGAIMLVGVPMLILPGPGLLAIGGGAVVATRGIKKVLGK